MAKVIEGQLNAEGKKFGIVVSRFNEMISKSLLGGAFDCLARHGADEEEITVVYVPGSFEIPLAAKNRKCASISSVGIVMLSRMVLKM